MRDKMIFIFITLTSCVCAGTFVVNVTQTSYQAEEDQDITLEWTFTTTNNIDSLSIFCNFIKAFRTFILFHLHEGVEVPESQDPWFAGRVQWDKDVLREGRLRLQVSRLKTEDSGLYRCDMLRGGESDFRTCQLTVSAADESQTESPTVKPESEGGFSLFAELGLIAAGALLGLISALILMVSCLCLHRKKIQKNSTESEV